MTTPTMKEMVQTFLTAARDQGYHGGLNCTAGLTAVIEEHFGPMLVEAFAAGVSAACATPAVGGPLWPWQGEKYAARIIEQMKDQKP